MLNWFEKDAPIRTKFKVLLGAHSLLASVGLVTTIVAGGSMATIAVAAIAVALTVATVLVSGKLICTPYVDTVVRMEGLAAGDTSSPIAYFEHGDCVGRMTKAMATFRDNAKLIDETRKANEEVVAKLSEGLNKLAANQLQFRLTEPFPAQYEGLRADYNNAIDALSDTVLAVRNASASVLTGATEIRTASDDLSQRNEQQAASLEETSAAMNRVTEAVKDTASSATEVQKSIGDAHKEASTGGEVVHKAIAAMAEIERSAQEISQIIGVIDAISFQTNLLALNAGVEAARAGDAGKGFAVVANEVRALAQRSADAAKNIKELITASTQQVEGGVALVGETGTLLEKIVARIAEVNQLIGSITEASNSQAASIEQVNAAVGEMDRMTQQNAAMVEQSTAAARSLGDEASELSSLVSRFQVGDGAKAATSQMARPAAPARRAPARKAAPRSAPVVQGNLAIKSDEDWSEF